LLRVEVHVLDDDPVDVRRLPEGDVAVLHVRSDQGRVPFQREAPTAAPAAAKAHLIALYELQPSDLPCDHGLFSLPEDDTGVRRPVGPAVDAPRRIFRTADGDREGSLLAADDVILDHAEAAAESTVTGTTLDVQFVPIHEDWHVPLVHFVRCDVRLPVAARDQARFTVSIVLGAPPAGLRLYDAA